MAETKELHVICARCGAPCYYVKHDRVAIGSEALIERWLTCSGCGSCSSTPAYFPIRNQASRCIA